MDNLLCVLTDPRAILPTRGTEGSAGLDFYALEDVVIPPLETRTYKTGICIQLPKGHYGHLCDKSSMCTQYHLKVNGGVIDWDYRGEVAVVLYNNDPQRLSVVEYGKAIAQLIVKEYKKVNPVAVSNLSPTERGHNGFGSTSKALSFASAYKPIEDYYKMQAELEKADFEIGNSSRHSFDKDTVKRALKNVYNNIDNCGRYSKRLSRRHGVVEHDKRHVLATLEEGSRSDSDSDYATSPNLHYFSTAIIDTKNGLPYTVPEDPNQYYTKKIKSEEKGNCSTSASSSENDKMYDLDKDYRPTYASTSEKVYDLDKDYRPNSETGEPPNNKAIPTEIFDGMESDEELYWIDTNGTHIDEEEIKNVTRHEQVSDSESEASDCYTGNSGL